MEEKKGKKKQTKTRGGEGVFVPTSSQGPLLDAEISSAEISSAEISSAKISR